MAKGLIRGDKEVLRMLKNAPDHAYAVTRTAMAKSTTPIAKAMRANAKEIEDTGAYYRSITKVTRSNARFKRNGVVVAAVGPQKGYMETSSTDTGAEQRRRPENYAHLVEYGTRHSRPLLVQTRAFDSTKNESVGVFLSTVPKALEKRLAKDGNR